MLLCRYRNSALQTDGWQNATVVTYDVLPSNCTRPCSPTGPTSANIRTPSLLLLKCTANSRKDVFAWTTMRYLSSSP